MKKINHKKLVEDIGKVLDENIDFLFDMDCKLLPNGQTYTQKEAEHMAEILGKMYMIAHCLHCTACQGKYIQK